MPSSLLQVVNNLLQTCHDKLETSSANTTCEQTCYNLFADLQQLVRFYACNNKRQEKAVTLYKSRDDSKKV